MKEKVTEFVIEYLEREYKLPEDVNYSTFNFVKTGYVDSIGTIQFITTLEDEFDIEFSDEDLADEDNQIIGNIVNLVIRKIKEK